VKNSTTVVLGQRQVYILPTRHGLLFGLVLLALLLASVNYNNGLGFLLTFLLTSMAIVAVLDTQRNLLRLRISPGACAPVFAGDNAQFTFCLHNDTRAARRAVQLEYNKQPVALSDIGAQQSTCLPLAVPATQRGWLACPPLVVSTQYPLALMRAWTPRLHFEQRCLVYPAPATEAALTRALEAMPAYAPGTQTGGDDYSGLRAFRAGDSPQRISWKTLARGQGLHTKEFFDGGQQTLFFDWHALAPLDTETRLSLLCRAVLEAEGAGQSYGLRLPHLTLAPGSGAHHQHNCLEALALFEPLPAKSRA
jgi:uncharacterized protein (DUF58 family)